jgi:hypothetical protein
MGIFSTLFKKPQSDTYYEKRRRPRLNCAIATEMSDERGNTWSCKIVDMSENGFRIVTNARLRMGNAVNIIRPAVSAEVVWAMDSKAGLRILK